MTTNAKRAIIAFLKKKDELLKQLDPEAYSKSPYLVPEDIKEIEMWKDNECARVVWKMRPYNDMLFCPWCICQAFDMNFDTKACGSCGYGIRHGKCTDESSTYSTLTGGKDALVMQLKRHMYELNTILRPESK